MSDRRLTKHDTINLGSGVVVQLDELSIRRPGFALDLGEIRIQAGERICVVGPNGAGKTSLLESILGLTTVTSISGTILDVPFKKWPSAIKEHRRIGAQLQNVAFPGTLQVRDLLSLHKALYQRQSPAVAETLQIKKLSHKRYRQLSKGEKQRVDLYLALAHEPELALLDEPTTGLDRQFRGALLELLLALSNITVLMVSHSAEELGIASGILWLMDGRIQVQGPPDDLRKNLVGEIRATLKTKSETGTRKLLDVLTQNPAVRGAVQSGPCEISAWGGEVMVDPLREIVGGSETVREASFGHTSLDDLLKHLTMRGPA